MLLLLVPARAVTRFSPPPARRRTYCPWQLAPHFRLPLISLRELMSVVRPSKLIPSESLLDAVTYHSDPEQWSGNPKTVSSRHSTVGLVLPAGCVLGHSSRVSALFPPSAKNRASSSASLDPAALGLETDAWCARLCRG